MRTYVARTCSVLFIAALLVGCGGQSEDPSVIGGKGDTAWGWNGVGDGCSFNGTCSEGLTCQPANKSYKGSAETKVMYADHDEFSCQPPGPAGNPCDDNTDCQDSLECLYVFRAQDYTLVPGPGLIVAELLAAGTYDVTYQICAVPGRTGPEDLPGCDCPEQPNRSLYCCPL